MISCYLVTVAEFPNIAWVVLAKSTQEAFDKVLPLATRQGLLSRSLRVQDWCKPELRELIESRGWELLESGDKLTVLVDAMKEILTKIDDCGKTVSRLTEYLSLQATINNCELGKI